MQDWQRIPHEVLFAVFSYLDDYRDLVKINLVCKSWRASASDDMLWRRRFLIRFRLPGSTKPLENRSWRSEFQRLIDQVPNVPVQTLRLHRDEVLHVKFSHDGTELVSCSKDHTFVVWTDETPENDGKFRAVFLQDMSAYKWHHTVNKKSIKFGHFKSNLRRFVFVIEFNNWPIKIMGRNLSSLTR